ncbi:complement C1q subcomponent subunit C-like isoform X2 [Sphaeramia orbicularis]|nr:complement C1q subcomponent subunit C-like isoform X2 [Sphaeramia orbicularis]
MAGAPLLSTGQCDVSCKGQDGHPGARGDPGRDGWPGAKGEKGETAVMDDGPVNTAARLWLKGEMGSRGLWGPMGPKGYRGDVGTPGHHGNPGPPGPDGLKLGQNTGLLQHAHSAFSVIRTSNIYPPYRQNVTYQETVVNRPVDFNTATGHFTCRIPGVYYFVFHSVAKVSICLYIASNALENKLGFCDYNRNYDQVLSGGVVLQLTVGQKVWLESFRDQQPDSATRDDRDKQIIFSGFLLFSDK